MANKKSCQGTKLGIMPKGTITTESDSVDITQYLLANLDTLADNATSISTADGRDMDSDSGYDEPVAIYKQNSTVDATFNVADIATYSKMQTQGDKGVDAEDFNCQLVVMPPKIDGAANRLAKVYNGFISGTQPFVLDKNDIVKAGLTFQKVGAPLWVTITEGGSVGAKTYSATYTETVPGA